MARKRDATTTIRRRRRVRRLVPPSFVSVAAIAVAAAVISVAGTTTIFASAKRRSTIDRVVSAGEGEGGAGRGGERSEIMPWRLPTVRTSSFFPPSSVVSASARPPILLGRRRSGRRRREYSLLPGGGRGFGTRFVVPRGGGSSTEIDDPAAAGDTFDDASDNEGFVLPSSEIDLNLKSHSEEIASNEERGGYYSGPCESLPSLLSTIGFDVGDVALPDFDDEFRNCFDNTKNELIRVTSKPLLDERECDELIAAAEKHFEERQDGDDGDGGWTTLPSGRFDVAGTWIKDVPSVREKFDELLKTKLFPALGQLFPEVVGDPSDLRVQSAYLFKYTPESGEKTDTHMDSSLLSFTILLNDPREFEGGGTFYESLGTKGETVSMNRGDVTFRPGCLRHRGQPITSGKRYVIGGFVTVKGDRGCEHVRQLLTRGTDALASGDLPTARRLFDLARQLRPNFAETYMSVAHCLRKFGDDEGALRSYRKAYDLNPRNADAAFMVGVMHGERGDDDGAMGWYDVATGLNEYDGDAWYRKGLIHGRRNDPIAERSMYEKAVSIQPNHADAHVNLGVSHGEAGDVENEIECYERALSIQPGNVEALNNAKAAYYYQGVDLYQKGDFEGSLRSFRRILDGIAPGEPAVMDAYEAVREAKRKRDLAEDAVEGSGGKREGSTEEGDDV